MNTTTEHFDFRIRTRDRTLIPQTARGRALFTVDWYLNGRPVLMDHDHPRIKLKGGFAC